MFETPNAGIPVVISAMRVVLLICVVSLLAIPQAAVAQQNDNRPTACFTSTPSFPIPGEAVSFDSSCSFDNQSYIAERAWDLDNDGSYDDGTGVTASRSFPTAGNATVGLRVWDAAGNNRSTSRTVTVNGVPTASFTFSPSSPQTGQSVTFTSNSSDSGGSIASQAWDLDNDGSFDDGTATTASRSFPAAGDYTVRLRVTDNRGAQATSTRTVTASNRAPTASFTFAPALPSTGQSVTFTSTSTDPDGSIASQAWDLDNDGSFDDGTATTASRSFPAAGDYTVRLRVVDNNGAAATVANTIAVANRAPSAAFTFAPDAPLSGDLLTFTSASTDVDGTIASQAWDLDNDGSFDDGIATTAAHAFAKPGTYTVSLRVVDNRGTAAVATHTLSVGNRPPVASFVHVPSGALAGDPIQLTSTAFDPDGTVGSEDWDLDGDGQFDDATGPTVSFTPPSAGSHPVGLRITDDLGAVSDVMEAIVVTERPLPDPRVTPEPFDTGGPVVVIPEPDPNPIAPIAPMRWLDPFPVVRVRGVTTRKGARLTLLSVTAPNGARAELTCTTKGCPTRRQRLTVKTRGGKATGVVRFRRMERFLAAGTRFQIAVTQDGLVGKYTRFKIRRIALPTRTDRCMLPGSPRPVICPEAP
jgi:predicted outer membrane repeat protein